MCAQFANEVLIKKHIEEAEANYLRYEILKEKNEFGWAAVLLFYSALHLIEAHRCKFNPAMLVDDHMQRKYYVARELGAVNRQYSLMFQLSRSVRYLLYQCSEDDLKFAHGDYNLLWIEMQRFGITWP